MGLAMYVEQGARQVRTPTSIQNRLPIVGGPGKGKAFFPSIRRRSRTNYTSDRGGMPEKCGLFAKTTVNLCANPRFWNASSSGWTGVDAQYGAGLWGWGWGRAIDTNAASADLDAYYTYNKGSALGSSNFFVSIWARCATGTGSTYTAASVSVKVRAQDTGGAHIVKSATARQVRESDGWVLLSLMIEAPGGGWTGNVLYVGVEFATWAGATDMPAIALSGMMLANVGATSRIAAYHDGSFDFAAWSGTSDGSTSTSSGLVGEDGWHARCDVGQTAFSAREGFVSIFGLWGASPLAGDWTTTAGADHYLYQYGDGSEFGFSAKMTSSGSAGTHTWTLIVGKQAITLTTANWPHCPFHLVLSWDTSGARAAIKGYFDPTQYSLASNVATGSASSGPFALFYGDIVPNKVYIGADIATTSYWEGYLWDFNLGNRGLGISEMLGILRHGPGPYSGTTAWMPLDEDTNARHVEAVSFHPDGPMGLAKAGYSPASGLMTTPSGTVSGSGLVDSTTQNVMDSFQIVGRQGDTRKMLQAVGDLARLFELAHRSNAQGSPLMPKACWSLPTDQPGVGYYTYPAPKRVQSRLFWGDVALDSRITSYYGQRGTLWGSVRFERWGYWEGPSTKLVLSDEQSQAPIMTANGLLEVINCDVASGSSKSGDFWGRFVVPEGMLDGDLEAPAFFKGYTTSAFGRFRMARRSRGRAASNTESADDARSPLPFLIEAEYVNNTINGTSTTTTDAAASSGHKVYVDLAAGADLNWITFSILDDDDDCYLPSFGEYRAVAFCNVTGGSTGSEISFQARIRAGDYLGAWSERVTPATIVTHTGAGWQSIDLGIFRLPPIEVPQEIGMLTSTGAGVSLGLDLRVIVSGADAERVHCDRLCLFPVDECYTQAEVAVATSDLWMSSYDAREVATGVSSSAVDDITPLVSRLAIIYGRGPHVQPGSKNLFNTVIEGNVDADGNSAAASVASFYLQMHYRPRYLLAAGYQGGGGGGWA